MNKILKVCGEKIGHLAILQTGLTQWHSVMGGLNHHGFLTRLSDLTKGAHSTKKAPKTASSEHSLSLHALLQGSTQYISNDFLFAHGNRSTRTYNDSITCIAPLENDDYIKNVLKKINDLVLGT